MMRLAPTDRWRSDRVECFLLEPEHVDERYVRWLSDPAVNRFLESRFVTHDLASVRAFVAARLLDPNCLFLGIRSRRLGRHVGNIKVGPIDAHHGLGEVGIMIGDRDAWGMGIGSDAIGCVVEICKHELRLRKLTAGCYASNLGSSRAFEKAAFHLEGVRPGHFLLEGAPEDLVLMARFLV